MVNIDMTWDEIKRRAKNGASVSVLADLNGVKTNVMKGIIAELEEQTGEKLEFTPKASAVKKGMKKGASVKDDIISLAKQGLKPKEIAEKVGTYPQYVYNIISKLKKESEMPDPEPKPSKDEKADEAMLDVVLTQIYSLEDILGQLDQQAEPIRYQLNKWIKIKEAIENDTL